MQKNLVTLTASDNKIVKIATYDGESLLAKVVLVLGEGMKYSSAKCLAVLLASTACILDGFHGVGATNRSSAIQADVVKSSQTVKPERKNNQIEFKSVLMGDGIADGSRMYFTRYESSRKHSLYETWISFDLPSKAERKIRELLSSPLKKLRENTEIDKNGKQVGKRVLVLRQLASQGKTQAILAWNEGARYQEIRSDSLEDVLAFEDQYRRPVKQDAGPLGTLHIPGHGDHESEGIPISSPK